MRRKPLALFVLAVSILAVPSVRADQASARARLEQDGLAFTPEAFLAKVAEGDTEHVKVFLEAGIDPSARNTTNRTALWVATERKQTEVLEALLEAGVNPNRTLPPWKAASRSSSKPSIPEMPRSCGCSLKRAPTRKAPTTTAFLPLAEAARTGQLETCKILLKAGADPNAAPGGFPLLYGPINENQLEVVHLLIDSGAKLGEHKADLMGAAKSPEMTALLEAAE